LYHTNICAALTTAAFHPDGHLFAAGGLDGQIKLFEVKTGAAAATFDASGPVQSLSFSENGTWLAAAVKNDTTIQIWDLRKAAQIKLLDIGSPVTSIRWDYTGQFLLATSPSGLTVQHYSKTTKQWTEPLRSSVASRYAEWGPEAQSVVVLGMDGSISELTSP
jgi:pre-mRNA-processing factor 19